VQHTASVLEVGGLAKRYGDVVALDGVDLSIGAGEICGLLGPNGAGKTTLASIVAGLRTADAGRVTIDGVDALGDGRRARTKLGYAPQELSIYPTVSVRENLIVFGELADVRGPLLRRRIDEVADGFELAPLLDRPARAMSGGEKRRLHTAAAMLHRPALLLLDEPTTGVDVGTRARLLDAVRSLAADGTAICYSTHYLPEIEALNASVAIIDHGRVIARGAVAQLVAAHGDAAVDIIIDPPVPAVVEIRAAVPDGSIEHLADRIRIRGPHAANEIAHVLVALGSDAQRVRRIEVVSASLEGVFLALTGRRFDAEPDPEPQEVITHGART
jgi:ABC-2 type transport system ATP-binding protein